MTRSNKPSSDLRARLATSQATNCPLSLDMQAFSYHENGLLKSMRRLRQDLNKCRYCPRYPTCPVMNEFNSIVAQAIQEITDEFNHV